MIIRKLKLENRKQRKIGRLDLLTNNETCYLLPPTYYLSCCLLPILLLATFYLLVGCFDGNYIIRHITDPLFDTTFTVTVINGTGGGEYKEGDTVTITANAPQTGQVFKNWTVNSGGVTLDNADSDATKFTMPKNDVRVIANFDTLPNYYTLTVTNGTGSGTYAEGASVTITANAPPAGQQFKEWTTTGITLASTSPVTFTMPSNDVTATAIFEITPIVLTGTVSSSDLQTAINNAIPGAKIILPAGSHTLDTQITVNKNITIEGTAPGTTLISNHSGYLFAVSSSTLNLGGNNIPLTLIGQGSGQGVRLNTNGKLDMYDGVTISGFNQGVNVQFSASSTFTMYGGIIENNSDGIWANGTIIMYGGIIKNNTNRGVYAQSGASLTMHGGTITGIDHPEPNINYAFSGVTFTARYGDGTNILPNPPDTFTSYTIYTITGKPAP